ncbi:MAG: hypothetical protein E7357_06170 [Clostridiales bacterium]|nr:hypothetical protein [Clostridiales bacterium]
MSKIWRKLTIGVLAVCIMLFGVFFSACSKDEEEDDNSENEITETTTVTINYHFAELSLFDTFQLKIEENESVEWSSENASIASVDASGLVTANGYGETKIIAKSGDISDSCTISVLNEGLVPAIETNVDNNQLSMILADQFLLNCVVSYNESSYDDGTFTFTSSDESVVSVDANTGKLIANAYGQASVCIKATWRGFEEVYLTEYVSVMVVPNISMNLSSTKTELDTVSGEMDGITYDNQAKIDFSISLEGVDSTDSVEYVWEYSKDGIVSVDRDGNLVAQRKGEVDVVLSCTVGNEVYRSLPIHFVVNNPEKIMTEVLAYALNSNQALTIDGLDGMPTEIRIGDIDFTANATFSEGNVVLHSIDHAFAYGETTLYVDTSIYSYQYAIYFASHVIADKDDFLSYMNGWSGAASAETNGTSDDYVVLAQDIAFDGANLALKTGSDFFMGHFNGLGHTVSDITLSASQTASGSWTIAGLFGRIGVGATVENLAVTGITTSDHNTYFLAQYVQGTLQNIYLRGTNTAATAKSVTQVAWNSTLGGLPTIKNCIVNVTYTQATDAVAFNNADGTGAAKNLENCYVIGNAARVSPWSDETRTVYADGYTFLNENKSELAKWNGYWSLKGDAFYFGDSVVALVGTRNDTLYTATEIDLLSLTGGEEIVSLTVNGVKTTVPANGALDVTNFSYGVLNELQFITATGKVITQPFITASHVISTATGFMDYMNGWSGGASATTNGTSDDYVVLTANIDLDGQNVALKTSADYFAGTFNGLGHTVTDMKYTPKSVNGSWTIAGIFGRVSTSGVIENVAFTGITSSDGANSYIISDYMCGVVKNVYVQAAVNNLKNVIRLAWGSNGWGTVSNCIMNIQYAGTTSNATFNDADGQGAANATAVKNTYAIGNAAAFSPWSDETRTVYENVSALLTTEKTYITAENGWSEYWTFDESGNLYFATTKVA